MRAMEKKVLKKPPNSEVEDGEIDFDSRKKGTGCLEINSGGTGGGGYIWSYGDDSYSSGTENPLPRVEFILPEMPKLQAATDEL